MDEENKHNTIQPLKKKKRKKEIPPFVATWVDLEGSLLGEISEKQKDRYRILSLTRGI